MYKKIPLEASHRVPLHPTKCVKSPIHSDNNALDEGRSSWAYSAALCTPGCAFGRCEHKSGIAPFDRLVDQVMTLGPYKEARRALWIVDSGSTHRRSKFVERLQGEYNQSGAYPWSCPCELAQPDRDLFFGSSTKGPYTE